MSKNPNQINNKKEIKNMIFITYWELNDYFDPAELGEMAQMVLEKKLYPVEGTKMLAWYISTTDYWGVTISEADTEEQMIKGSQVWRIAKPGVFKVLKTSQAMETAKVIPILTKLKKQLQG
jgi:hypothetical protein